MSTRENDMKTDFQYTHKETNYEYNGKRYDCIDDVPDENARRFFRKQEMERLVAERANREASREGQDAPIGDAAAYRSTLANQDRRSSSRLTPWHHYLIANGIVVLWFLYDVSNKAGLFPVFAPGHYPTAMNPFIEPSYGTTAFSWVLIMALCAVIAIYKGIPWRIGLRLAGFIQAGMLLVSLALMTIVSINNHQDMNNLFVISIPYCAGAMGIYALKGEWFDRETP